MVGDIRLKQQRYIIFKVTATDIFLKLRLLSFFLKENSEKNNSET